MSGVYYPGCKFGPESKANPGNPYFHPYSRYHLCLCFRKCIGDKSATLMFNWEIHHNQPLWHFIWFFNHGCPLNFGRLLPTSPNVNISLTCGCHDKTKSTKTTPFISTDVQWKESQIELEAAIDEGTNITNNSPGGMVAEVGCVIQTLHA